MHLFPALLLSLIVIPVITRDLPGKKEAAPPLLLELPSQKITVFRFSGIPVPSSSITSVRLAAGFLHYRSVTSVAVTPCFRTLSARTWKTCSPGAGDQPRSQAP